MTRVYKNIQKASNTDTTETTRDTNMPSNHQTNTATASPLPIRVLDPTTETNGPAARDREDPALVSKRDEGSSSSSSEQSPPPEHPAGPSTPTNAEVPDNSLKLPSLAHQARLRIHFEDLTHPAVARFLSVMPVSSLLQTAISNVQKHLFTPPGKHHNSSKTLPQPPQTTVNPSADPSASVFHTSTMSSRPPPPQKPIHPPERWTPQEVRSVTLIIRSMDGVAYTTGTTLDDAHKEIHLSIGYIEHVMKSSAEKSNPAEAFKYELMGVVTHEMVHVFQHNASSSCPGGLVEGIADYVRLKSELSAKTWNPWPASKKTRGEKWDEGYSKTAWFLEWAERQVKMGVIGKLNFEMRDRQWSHGEVWKDVMGESVKDMWEKYERSWEEMNRRHDREEEECKEN